ncbi:hypothetical protein KR054_004265, partial [Drosophila jambulina]
TDDTDNLILTPESSTDCGSEPSVRLHHLLLDYKQFLAARTIQRYVRGWLLRRILRKMNRAATIISSCWRGYSVRSKRFAMVEAELQKRAMVHYDEAANKLQALFRGWQTRINTQNFEGMTDLRTQYTEDILCTLAKWLRRMQKDHFLPGVYGLRVPDLLTKIEKLSLTFGYRFHNGRMRAALAAQRALLARRRLEFRKALFYTPAPFPGHESLLKDLPGYCVLKSIGPQQQRVFLMYDKSTRNRHVKNIISKAKARLRYTIAVNRDVVKVRFCRDLIGQGAILAALKNPDIKRTSEKVRQFLQDLQETAAEYSCHCRPKVLENDWCT